MPNFAKYLEETDRRVYRDISNYKILGNDDDREKYLANITQIISQNLETQSIDTKLKLIKALLQGIKLS